MWISKRTSSMVSNWISTKISAKVSTCALSGFKVLFQVQILTSVKMVEHTFYLIHIAGDSHN